MVTNVSTTNTVNTNVGAHETMAHAGQTGGGNWLQQAGSWLGSDSMSQGMGGMGGMSNGQMILAADQTGGQIFGMLAGQNETKVGNIVKSIPGLSTVGNFINAAFGSHINDAFVNQTNANVNALQSRTFGSNTNADVLNDWRSIVQMSHVSKSEVGSDGWFNDDATDKKNELNDNIDRANDIAMLNFGHAVKNADRNTDLRIAQGMINAYGGPINSFRKYYNDGGNLFNTPQFFTFEPQIHDDGGYLSKAKALIRQNEGWRAKPYKDAPQGKAWRSAGYGFNDSGFREKYPEGISKHYEHGITKEQAEQELDYFVRRAERTLKGIYGKQWDSFNDNQKAAIMDTYYQRPASVGKKSRFYKAVTAGEDAGKYLGVAGYSKRNNIRQGVFGGGAVPKSSGASYSSGYSNVDMASSSGASQIDTGELTYPSPILERRSPIVDFDLSGIEPTKVIDPKINLSRPAMDLNFMSSPIAQAPRTQAPTIGTVEDFLASYGDVDDSLLFAHGGFLGRQYDGGGSYSYTKPLDNVFVDSEGNVIDPSMPSAKGTIRTPDVVIATRDPRKAVPTANSLNTSNIESTVKEAMKNYFVGNLSDDEVRRRLYHNLAPYGYTHTIARLESAIKNNTSHEFDRRHKNDRDRQDIWAEYLGIPEEERKTLFDSSTSILRDSQYSPTVGKEQNIKYKAISNPSEADVRDLIQHAEVLPIGKNKVVAGGIGHALGRYTIGHNYDNKGEYVSYYDKWDLNPFSNAGEDLSLGIGKPVNIYDRIYLDDYYGTPEEYRGSTYIPEVTVTAKRRKHEFGGNLFPDGGSTGNTNGWLDFFKSWNQSQGGNNYFNMDNSWKPSDGLQRNTSNGSVQDWIGVAQTVGNTIANWGEEDPSLGRGGGYSMFGMAAYDLLKGIRDATKSKRESIDQKLGIPIYACGGRLYPDGGALGGMGAGGGGSVGAMGYAQVGTAALKLASNAVHQAKLTVDEDKIDRSINRYGFGFDDYARNVNTNGDLLDLWQNNATVNPNLSARDFRDKSEFDDFLNSYAASWEGFNAGQNFGPWGAAIGAVVGGISSRIGSQIGKNKAKHAAEEANEEIERANERRQATLEYLAERVDHENDLRILQNMDKRNINSGASGGDLNMGFGLRNPFIMPDGVANPLYRAFGGGLTHKVGDIINVSPEEARYLKSLGYEFNTVG